MNGGPGGPSGSSSSSVSSLHGCYGPYGFGSILIAIFPLLHVAINDFSYGFLF